MNDSAIASANRLCLGCRQNVTNANLGGWDGKGALSGSLWCIECVNKPDARQRRREEFKRAQLKAAQSARAEVDAILAEFSHLDGLLAKSHAVLTKLRCDPTVPYVQRELVLLSREYVRDVAVMIYGFRRRHW
jgi:hypothetical protein